MLFPYRRDTHPRTNRWLLRLSLIITCILAVFVLWITAMNTFFIPHSYEPHASCYLWNPTLITLHAGSDSLIGLSYVAISLTLLSFVLKTRKDIPFQWVFVAFGIFIIACGGTHFVEVWTLWQPVYWFSGFLKFMTAVASVATAIALPPLIPHVMALIASAKVSEERRRQLEQAHQELEVMYQKSQELDQLKTAFFANVSHELRTPLTLILGPLRMLLDEKTLTAEQQQRVSMAERNAQLLLNHVNDLLALAKLEAGQMSLQYAEVDLAQLLRFSAAHFELLAHERQITVEADTPPSLIAQVDSQKLQRVFVNILSNAFKFTPQSGIIRWSLRQDGDHAHIVVEDSGPGIPPEQRQAVFERFRQLDASPARQFEGTGLGLAIASDFVSLLGGTISICDTSLGGACFTIDLPLSATHTHEVQSEVSDVLTSEDISSFQALPTPLPIEQKVASLIATSTEQQETEKPLLLLLEDNLDMAHFIVETLSQEYRVATATNGQEGLEQAIRLIPDLIISDVMMPGMSGDQFVPAARRVPELANIPIILLSARTDESLRIQLLREGAQDYLVKPFSAEELRVRITNLLAMKRVREVLQQEVAQQHLDIAELAKEVTEQKHEIEKVLAALRESEAHKDAFLSMASHELKTPITSIKVFTQLLHTRCLQEQRTKDIQYLKKMEVQINKLINLVSTLLDVTKIQAGKLELNHAPFVLSEMLQEAIDTVQHSARHTISLTGNTNITLIGDQDRLGQVLINLLTNAIKYSPEADRVDVDVKTETDQVIISVRDYGIGIPPEHQAKIFERFYRVSAAVEQKYPGLGIGLAIAREIVSRHGGTIHVESEEGAGSTFTVTLPLTQTSTEEATSSATPTGV